MERIAVLGCGWLGLPLAKSLIKKGFTINGSTTSKEKISILKAVKIRPFLIVLGENKIADEIDLFLDKSDVLIIAIPPKLRSESSENFVSKIQNLIPFIENSSVKKVLFVSSTSVYADDNKVISEADKPHPDTESGKQLVQVEHLLQNNKNFQTTVVRFGGLIGEDRHPITFLSGRKNIENPDAPINLIHQEDCIGIIQSIIEKKYWHETLNAVAPFHPTRKTYYTQKAIELNLLLPEFDESKPSVGKTILSNKIETILNYQFKNKL